jgi:hypothetical protein
MRAFLIGLGWAGILIAGWVLLNAVYINPNVR